MQCSDGREKQRGSPDIYLLCAGTLRCHPDERVAGERPLKRIRSRRGLFHPLPSSPTPSMSAAVHFLLLNGLVNKRTADAGLVPGRLVGIGRLCNELAQSRVTYLVQRIIVNSYGWTKPSPFGLVHPV